MIDPKELRIGNTIKTNCSSSAEIYSIASDNTFNHYNDGYVISSNSDLEDAKPIPLTSEILNKCGFTWNQHWLEKDLSFCNWWMRFSNGRYDHLSIFQYQNADRNESTVTRIDFGRNRPEYLHQLQNLYFALTGEELKIEL